MNFPSKMMKNFLLALLTGLLLTFAWPVDGIAPLLFFAFVPLLYAEYSIRLSEKRFKKWKIFGLSYFSFFLWNIFTTYWLFFSTVFGGAIAVIFNSLFMSLVFLLYHVVAKRTTYRAGSAFLICFWICFEYLHLNWEFSWPWLNLGNGFSEAIALIQWYEFTGTFGGTLWVWLANFGILTTILLYKEHREKSILYRGAIYNSALIGIPILISLLLLKNYSGSEKSMEAVVLQPNIDPYTEKYNTNDTRIGRLLTEMAKPAVTPETRIVIAPETVFADGTPLTNFRNSEAFFFTREFVKDHPQTSFLSGVSMYDRFSDPEKVSPQSNRIGPADWYDDYNSAFMINASDSVQFYHKSKLVVGVENFPYQDVLKPILGDVMIDLGGTVAMKTTQPDREVFTLTNGVEVAPIICYESVYGEYVTDYVENGADFLTIITNDAWWGTTPGHKQHLSYSKLRAIENRRAVARSANTGISAFINEKGEILASLDYGERGALRGEVSLNNELTFYVRHGNYIARVSIFLAILIFLFAMIKWKRRRK